MSCRVTLSKTLRRMRSRVGCFSRRSVHAVEPGRPGGMTRLISALALWISVSATVASAEYDQTYKGLFVWGPEVHTFRPCGQKAAYWVSASSWVIGPAIDYYRLQYSKPYAPIYIEFRGHLLDEILDGFAKDYSGLIRVSQVLLLDENVPRGCE